MQAAAAQTPPPLPPRQKQETYYPITLRVLYQITIDPTHRYRGEGRTVRMSRTRILLETAERLPLAKLVTLSIDWPVQLDNRIGLTFEVQGRTLTAQGQDTLVEILRHEFRIKPAARSQARSA